MRERRILCKVTFRSTPPFSLFASYCLLFSIYNSPFHPICALTHYELASPRILFTLFSHYRFVLSSYLIYSTAYRLTDSSTPLLASLPLIFYLLLQWFPSFLIYGDLFYRFYGECKNNKFIEVLSNHRYGS